MKNGDKIYCIENSYSNQNDSKTVKIKMLSNYQFCNLFIFVCDQNDQMSPPQFLTAKKKKFKKTTVN